MLLTDNYKTIINNTCSMLKANINSNNMLILHKLLASTISSKLLTNLKQFYAEVHIHYVLYKLTLPWRRRTNTRWRHCISTDETTPT